jgi:hypothetical protein
MSVACCYQFTLPPRQAEHVIDYVNVGPFEWWNGQGLSWIVNAEGWGTASGSYPLGQMQDTFEGPMGIISFDEPTVLRPEPHPSHPTSPAAFWFDGVVPAMPMPGAWWVTCPGDYNGDSSVNVQHLLWVLAYWDHPYDTRDYLSVLAFWDETCTAPPIYTDLETQLSQDVEELHEALDCWWDMYAESPGCVEVPTGCNRACTQQGRSVTKVIDETWWCSYYFKVEVWTGWYNDTYFCCDVEDDHFEYCTNAGFWGNNQNWLWQTLEEGVYYTLSDPQYTPENPQHYWTYNWYPRLAQAVVGDPHWGDPGPYDANARWVIGFRHGTEGQRLTCPRAPSITHTAATSYLADTSPNSLDCPWDFDDNGTVNTVDFLHLQAHPEWFDVSDFLALLAYWGGCPHT